MKSDSVNLLFKSSIEWLAIVPISCLLFVIVILLFSPYFYLSFIIIFILYRTIRKKPLNIEFYSNYIKLNNIFKSSIITYDKLKFVSVINGPKNILLKFELMDNTKVYIDYENGCFTTDILNLMVKKNVKVYTTYIDWIIKKDDKYLTIKNRNRNPKEIERLEKIENEKTYLPNKIP